MPVIGTAGHVDHGKSTLVQALTGRDPDRWQEEKDRGLTIDLGFAWTTLDDGTEISFIDVPGHERFIKNMLAGTDGFDVALFVVAADEGWMPQSEEHLAVLDLLGVARAVVALTKVDRVDADLVELATLEVEEQLEGTSLDGAPIVPVSAVERQGIDAIKSAIAAALADVAPEAAQRPRMWIDRAFTIAGAGTVVTGTLVTGTLRVGDTVALHPGPSAGRIRSLQSHETDRKEVGPGTRVAVNIVGPERDDITRGAMLGLPGQWVPTDRMLVSLTRARYVETPLTDRGAYHLHIGSGAWPVRLRTVDSAGDDELAILTTADPIPLQMGDRFVLREVGRQSVVAGGRVLEPVAPRKGKDAARTARALLDSIESAADSRAAALLQVRGAEVAATLAAHSGGGDPAGAVTAGSLLLAPERAADLADETRELVAAFHRDHPLRPGIPKASLASGIGVSVEALAAVIDSVDDVEERGSAVAADGFQPQLDPAAETVWQDMRAALETAGLTVPRLQDLSVDQELLHALLREERLVQVSSDLVYLPEQIDEIIERLAGLPARFTVADFRDEFGLTRKYAVPLLEWLDRRRATVRHGDERTVSSS